MWTSAIALPNDFPQRAQGAARCLSLHRAAATAHRAPQDGRDVCAAYLARQNAQRAAMRVRTLDLLCRACSGVSPRVGQPERGLRATRGDLGRMQLWMVGGRRSTDRLAKEHPDRRHICPGWNRCNDWVPFGRPRISGSDVRPGLRNFYRSNFPAVRSREELSVVAPVPGASRFGACGNWRGCDLRVLEKFRYRVISGISQ
jgi:hypothetical protein